MICKLIKPLYLPRLCQLHGLEEDPHPSEGKQFYAGRINTSRRREGNLLRKQREKDTETRATQDCKNGRWGTVDTEQYSRSKELQLRRGSSKIIGFDSHTAGHGERGQRRSIFLSDYRDCQRMNAQKCGEDYHPVGDPKGLP